MSTAECFEVQGCSGEGISGVEVDSITGGDAQFSIGQ